MAGEADPTLAELDAFLLQQDPLGDHAAHGCPQADSAMRVDHPMPGHPRGHAPQRATHHARMTRIPQPRRDLSSPARPVVALLIDTQGQPLPLPHHLDLAQSESPSIVRTLSGAESRELLGGRFPEWV